MVKHVLTGKLPKTDESWFDRKSDDLIIIGDGKPPFELTLDTTEFERQLQDADRIQRQRRHR